MSRVAGCMQDFAGNSDLAQELTALIERDNDVPNFHNINVAIIRFGPGLHEGDGVHLNIEDEEGNALSLQFLGKPCMVNMIVSGEGIADLAKRDAHLLETRLHGAQGTWPADVHEQAIGASAHHPVIGGAVADVRDG